MKTEKGTKVVIGVSLLLMIAMYVLFTLGKSSLMKYIAASIGILMAVLLFIEGALYDYVRQKKYRHIGFGDVVVWLTMLAVMGLVSNSYFTIWGVANGAPLWIANAVKPVSIAVAIFSAILVVVHLVSDRFD